MKKIIKKITCLLSVMALSIIPLQTVLAEQDTGSITLTLGQGQDLTSVENVKVSCSKVADLVDGEYILLDEFKSTNVDLNKIETAEELQDTAEKLQDLVKNDYTENSDKYGVIKFKYLDIGVYLIKALDTTNYDEITPTLISIPTYNEVSSSMEYDIRVEPKHTLKTGSVKIKKANEKLDLLSGAEFTLFEDVNKNKVLDKEDKKVDILKETQKGIYEIDNLKYAYYLVRETKAPLGYVADEHYYPIIINGENQEVIVKNNDNGYFINKYKIGKVEVEKGHQPPKENDGFTPQTSDTLPLIFWCSMIIILGSSSIILFVRLIQNER